MMICDALERDLDDSGKGSPWLGRGGVGQKSGLQSKVADAEVLTAGCNGFGLGVGKEANKGLSDPKFSLIVSLGATHI